MSRVSGIDFKALSISPVFIKSFGLAAVQADILSIAAFMVFPSIGRAMCFWLTVADSSVPPRVALQSGTVPSPGPSSISKPLALAQDYSLCKRDRRQLPECWPVGPL